ncbi:MAG TPA: glycosyltransferase family 87 protein, partial [Cytophagaceae bacterium]|nr:glycosyltransferase family 87 protein [Cytophagaceae bacterium]
ARLLWRYPVKHYGIVLLPLVFLIPLKSNLYLGQSYLYVLAFLIEGFIFSEQEKKEVLSAIFFSLAIVLKLFPVVVLVYLFFTDKRKTVLYTLISSVFLFVLMIPFVGQELLTDYLFHSLPRLFSGEINDPYSSSYQSVTVLLKKFFVPDDVLNPGAWVNAVPVFIVLNAFFSATVLSFCVSILKKMQYTALFKFGWVLFVGILISGYGTSYSLLLFLFLFLAVNASEQTFNLNAYTYIYFLLFICVFPIHWLLGKTMLLEFIRLYALLALFVFVVYKMKVKASYRFIAGMTFVLILPAFSKYASEGDGSEYYLSKLPSLLLYDYEKTDHGIRIHYYDQEGNQQFIYPTNDNISPDTLLSVEKNQIFYKGMQLTEGNCKNKSPMLLNGKEVIYLSDKGRGIGMYALRKIKLPS